MEPQYIIVELRDTRVIGELNSEIERLRSELVSLSLECKRLSNKYGDECTINNRLVDLLRQNGIQIDRRIFK